MIRGNTVGAVAPVTDYDQTNSQNPDYLKGRETIASALKRAGDALPRSGGTMTGALDMGGNQIANVPAPEAEKDATNKEYVDGKIQFVTANLAVAGWSAGAPYSQQVIVAGVMPEKPPHVSPVFNSGNAAALMEACACVTYATAGTDLITFVCLNDKPQVDIPIQVEVHR